MNVGLVMQKKTFQQWVKQVAELSAQQFAVLKAEIEALESRHEVAKTIDEVAPACCPHCQHQNLQKFGIRNQLQRYRCKACKATFNRLTGTALSRLRKKHQWTGAIESLNERETLTQMQERLGVSRPTAVHWRKRFLAALQPKNPPVLSGIVEADETFVRRGQKGMLCVERSPRKRGEPARYGGTHPDDYVCVLMARDRNKQQAHQLTRSQKTEVFEEFLTPLIAKDSILCSDGLAGYRKFSQTSGIQHVVLTAKRQEFVKAGVYHIQNVNAYHSRLKHFLSRLKGVAAKNLGLYLGWLDHLDRLSNLSKPLSPCHIIQTFILNI